MHRSRLRLPAWVIIITYVVTACGCDAFRSVDRQMHTPTTFRDLPDEDARKLATDSPFLKIHMADGNLYVLQNWELAAHSVVTGTGTLYGPARNQISAGIYTVDVDSVALFETNVVHTSGVAGLLVFAGVLTVAVAIYCATNPKACFGSCPTFYVAGVNSLQPLAEGFSASIAPSLEASDIDDLKLTARGGDVVNIEMRNEAYETHVVRRVDMLAVPHAPGHRVFADADRGFWDARAVITASAAHGPEGDCLASIAHPDDHERFSETDSTDLRAAEFVEIEFDRVPPGELGLVVSCRQTLLTTYVLYQTFAYMGTDAGRWLAELERGRVSVSPGFVTDYLGCIDVQVENASGQFVEAGGVCEYGPIATDTHVIPLPDSARDTGRVRLVMTRGNWRVDWVALAALDGRITPVCIRPSSVHKAGVEDADARAALLDSTRTLGTFPGDRYTLRYALPEGGEYDLFLDAQGYYLEWIRQEWIKEENPAALTEMFASPDVAMKRLAPEFKRVEARMEQAFWSSRYERR